MPVPFGPQEKTVVIGDSDRLLPEEAYRVIGRNLSTGNVDNSVLLSHCRLLYVKLCEAEAKLMQVNRKLSHYDKAFKSWVPVIRDMRTHEETKCVRCTKFVPNK